MSLPPVLMSPEEIRRAATWRRGNGRPAPRRHRSTATAAMMHKRRTEARAYICILMDRLLVPNDASKIEAALDRFWKRSMAELWGPRPSARTVIRWRVMRAIELAAKRSRKEG